MVQQACIEGLYTMQFCGCELSFLFLSLPGMAMEGDTMVYKGKFYLVQPV